MTFRLKRAFKAFNSPLINKLKDALSKEKLQDTENIIRTGEATLMVGLDETPINPFSLNPIVAEFQNYLNFDVVLFSSKRDNQGINDWKRLEMNNIKHTSASKLGAIMKKFKGGSFYIDTDCDVLLSMESWTKAEKQRWKLFDEEKNRFIYNQGFDFEEDVQKIIANKFKDYTIKNWNKDELGLFLKSYRGVNYNIYCRPDYTLIHKDKNKIINIEVKSGSKTTKRLLNYKYQLALQSLLLNCMVPDIPILNYILFNDGLVQVTQKELQPLQVDILVYVPCYWKALQKGEFKKITVEELIARNTKTTKTTKTTKNTKHTSKTPKKLEIKKNSKRNER